MAVGGAQPAPGRIDRAIGVFDLFAAERASPNPELTVTYGSMFNRPHMDHVLVDADVVGLEGRPMEVHAGGRLSMSPIASFQS